jgi:hypothetical protein
MDAGWENSWNPGSGHPTRSPTCENWSGGILYNVLGSHFIKNHLFCPFWPLIKCKIYFLCVNLKNPSYKSCRQWKDAHHYQKWGQDSKFYYRTCTNQAQLGRKPSEVLLGAIFVERFSMKHWYAMFGIFPRYYITYHDSMHWFSIFLIFLNFLCPYFKYKSNSRCPPCVLGWWGPQVWDGLWGSTPSRHLHVFSPKIFEL